jgi:hypothetical protein
VLSLTPPVFPMLSRRPTAASAQTMLSRCKCLVLPTLVAADMRRQPAQPYSRRPRSARSAQAGSGMRLAVRRRAGKTVAVCSHPPVDRVLNEPDTGDPVEQQRDLGADRG